MKAVIDRDLLLRPLQALNGVVERRNNLPILGNVLLQAHAGGFELVGTDMDVELVLRIEHEVLEGGATTVAARKLLDIWKALPEGARCEVQTEGEQLQVRSGRSRFSLATLPAADFPRIGDVETVGGFDVEASVLRRALASTSFAMGHHDARYYLNGLLLDVAPGRVRAVATDGHRLAMTEFPVDAQSTGQYIVPRKGVLELERLLGDEGVVQVRADANHLSVERGRERLTTKLIDGRFPDYERVLPRPSDKVLRASREALRQTLTRTSILSNERFRGIKLVLGDDVLVAVAQNPENEVAEEEMEVSYRGGALEIGFNVTYLVDAVTAVEGEDVVLELTDANSSCLIQGAEGGRSRYVVMPMRL